MAAQLIHSFEVTPGNAGGPGQTFTLEAAGRYSLDAEPAGSVVGLEWLASADPVRWAKWDFLPDNGIYVTKAAAPQTFRLQYGEGGAVVTVYFEEGA